MERRTLKEVVASKAAVKRAGARATKAKLEGRVVPVGYIRSAQRERLPREAAVA